MKVHKGVFYFTTFQGARQWAQDNGWPIDYLRCYGKGWAVQACNSGTYAGPEQLTWPGPDWVESLS